MAMTRYDRLNSGRIINSIVTALDTEVIVDNSGNVVSSEKVYPLYNILEDEEIPSVP